MKNNLPLYTPIDELTCDMAYPGLQKFAHCYPYRSYVRYGL